MVRKHFAKLNIFCFRKVLVTRWFCYLKAALVPFPHISYMLHGMVPIFIILARVINDTCIANALLWYIRVIFLILARAIIMELLLLLCYGGKGISSSSP